MIQNGKLLFNDIKARKQEKLSLRLIGIRMGNFSLNQERRTMDITKYLTKVDEDLAEVVSKMIEYVCPICALQIKAPDERILADHVNRCLLMMVGFRIFDGFYS